MRNRPVSRGMLSILLTGAVLAAALVPLTGCMRTSLLPGSDADIKMALSEPRPVDKLDVPRVLEANHVYRVGPRDVLRVDVRKEPAIGTQPYVVTEEGIILLPNFGAVKVEGLTTTEIEKKINDFLSEYLYAPDAKVGVQEHRSKLIYVVGQVANPGVQIMRADMLTLHEAIYAAGLPTEEAALQRALVVSPSDEHPIVRQVDLTDIIYRGKMAENILLRPGDTVVVPARYGLNLRSALEQVFSPIERVFDFGIRYYSFKDIKDEVEDDGFDSTNDNGTVVVPVGQ